MAQLFITTHRLDDAESILVELTERMKDRSLDDAVRGRVMALRVGVALGGATIGAPIVGWVANRFGPRWSLALGAGACFAAALVAVYVLAGKTRAEALR